MITSVSAVAARLRRVLGAGDAIRVLFDLLIRALDMPTDATPGELLAQVMSRVEGASGGNFTANILTVLRRELEQRNVTGIDTSAVALVINITNAAVDFIDPTPSPSAAASTGATTPSASPSSAPSSPAATASPSSSVSTTPSFSPTPSRAAAPSASSTPSETLNPSTTSTPSISSTPSTTPSTSPTPSVTPSNSPPPSNTPAPLSLGLFSAVQFRGDKVYTDNRYERTIHEWDVTTWTERPFRFYTSADGIEETSDLAAHPSNPYVAVITNKQVVVYSTETTRPVYLFPSANQLGRTQRVLFHPTANLVYTTSTAADITVTDFVAKSSTPFSVAEDAGASRRRAFAINAAGTYLVRSKDTVLQLFATDATTGQISSAAGTADLGGTVFDVEYDSVADAWVVAVQNGENVDLKWFPANSLETASRTLASIVATTDLRDLAVQPSSSRVLLTLGTTVRVHNSDTGALDSTLTRHTSLVEVVAVHPTRELMVTTALDNFAIQGTNDPEHDGLGLNDDQAAKDNFAIETVVWTDPFTSRSVTPPAPSPNTFIERTIKRSYIAPEPNVNPDDADPQLGPKAITDQYTAVNTGGLDFKVWHTETGAQLGSWNENATLAGASVAALFFQQFAGGGEALHALFKTTNGFVRVRYTVGSWAVFDRSTGLVVSNTEQLETLTRIAVSPNGARFVAYGTTEPSYVFIGNAQDGVWTVTSGSFSIPESESVVDGGVAFSASNNKLYIATTAKVYSFTYANSQVGTFPTLDESPREETGIKGYVCDSTISRCAILSTPTAGFMVKVVDEGQEATAGATFLFESLSLPALVAFSPLSDLMVVGSTTSPFVFFVTNPSTPIANNVPPTQNDEYGMDYAMLPNWPYLLASNSARDNLAQLQFAPTGQYLLAGTRARANGIYMGPLPVFEDDGGV